MRVKRFMQTNSSEGIQSLLFQHNNDGIGISANNTEAVNKTHKMTCLILPDIFVTSKR